MTAPGPPPQVEAEVFHRVLRSGRNRALHLGARDAEGTLVDCVAKLPGLMENGTMHPLPSLLEWLGATLAIEFGIAAPASFEVIITSEFAASIGDPTIRAGVTRSTGSVYGGAFVPGVPMVAGDLVDASLRIPAAELLAFDVFIHNVDRRAENTNLFLGRTAPVAFDHGDAFAFVWPLIGAPDPVTDPVLSIAQRHAFASTVRRRPPPSLRTFRASLAALTDESLALLEAATPTAWQTGLASGKLAQILDILRRRRDAVQEWLPMVEAWMQS